MRRKQLKEEADRILAEASMRNKGGGCFDTRGNKIPCPVRYRSYEAIMSVKRAVFDDYGQFLREESIHSMPTNMLSGSKRNNPFFDFGTEASLAGDAFSFGQNFIYNDDFWLGKNGKFNSSDWGGNKYTGGKYKFAKNLGKLFGRTSNLLGAYSVYSTYKDETVSENQKVVDQTLNGVGFLGTYGAAFNFGFNLGYVIEDACDCNIQLNPRYFNAKYIKRHGWRFDKFFEDPERPYRSVFDQ